MIIEKAYAALSSAEQGEALNYQSIEGGTRAAHAFTALTGGGAVVPMPATIFELFGMLGAWCPTEPTPNEAGLGAGSRKPAKPITVITHSGSVPLTGALAPALGNTQVRGWHSYVLRRAMIDVTDPNNAWVTLHDPHGRGHLVQLPIATLLASAGGGPLFKIFVVGAVPNLEMETK